MIKLICAFVLVSFAVAFAAPQQSRQFFDELGTSTTPKPIVQIKRLINQQNGDGSYTYGFEAEDGTFKIETRDNLGNVKGKYGYIDANNELKIVDYSAGNGTGFDAQADFLPKPQQPLPVPVPQAPAPAGPPRGAAPRAQGAPQPQPAPSAVSDPSGSFRADGQYIPSIALEGFSDDVDKDGFVDPIPTDGRIRLSNDRPRPSNPAPVAPPQFASVDFRGVPQQPSFQPAFQQAPVDRPQFPQDVPTRFLPQPQPQQQFLNPAFAPRQRPPQAFPAFQPQQPQPQFQQFIPQQQAPRFLPNASPVQGGVPVFQGASEQPRFVNPLSLQGRRPF